MWEETMIEAVRGKLYLRYHIADIDGNNIIVSHTPVVSSKELSKIYEPLVVAGLNVFAFDFCGTGASPAEEGYVTRRSIVQDFDAVVFHIRRQFTGKVFLYGSTGIGGIFAQYYVSSRNNVDGFAQFACLTYQETKGLGYPRFLVKLLCPVFNVLPNMRLSVKPPKYVGYHEEEDNQFYEDMLQLNPDFWKTDSKFLLALLEMAVAKDSALQEKITVPTLVFKTMHDRYFSPEHFDGYYRQLQTGKLLVTINDTHNSYYNRSDLYGEAILQWIDMLEIRNKQ